MVQAPAPVSHASPVGQSAAEAHGTATEDADEAELSCVVPVVDADVTVDADVSVDAEPELSEVEAPVVEVNVDADADPCEVVSVVVEVDADEGSDVSAEVRDAAPLLEVLEVEGVPVRVDALADETADCELPVGPVVWDCDMDRSDEIEAEDEDGDTVVVEPGPEPAVLLVLSPALLVALLDRSVVSLDGVAPLAPLLPDPPWREPRPSRFPPVVDRVDPRAPPPSAVGARPQTHAA